MRTDNSVTDAPANPMRRQLIEKTVLTLVMVACWLLLPETGYTSADTDNIGPHVAYMWCHANLWHLAGNLFVLWIVLYRGRLHLAPSLIIAFLCSFLPQFSIYGDTGVTMGFSGVLFAIVGIRWGAGRCPLEKFATKALPFALLGIVIPHLNWCIHFYCMSAGFIYGRYR